MSYTSLQKACANYLNNAHNWAVVRLAIAGKTAIDAVAMRDNPYIAIPAYADRLDSKLEARIRNYWRRARYFNATARTATTLTGFIFAKQPVMQAPDQIMRLNSHADNLAKEAVAELLSVGKGGFLVDIMENKGPATLAETMQIMPSITLYKAEQIIFFREEAGKLQEVRLAEKYDRLKSGSLFEYETRNRIRRLYLDDRGFYNVAIYNDDNTVKNYEIKSGGSPVKEILFFFAGAENNAPGYDKSPLFDLASENLGHYVLSADNLENLHFHGQGMTNIFTSLTREEIDELNPNGLDVGAGGSNVLEQGDRIEILQLSASGAIPAAMKEAESRMIMAGAMLVTNTNAQTLGAKKIEFGAATSTLKNIADNTGKALEDSLKAAARLLNIAPSEVEKISYKLNNAMPTDDLSTQDLQLVLTAVQGSQLPKSAFFDAARARGIITATNEEIQEQLNSDPIL